MYSTEWFETFAAHRPAEDERAELVGIASHIPRQDFPRVIDIGCGVGRIAGPLAARGYNVTGIDIKPNALSIAREQAPGPQYIALDQRHVGRLRWEFDAVLVIWNSLGFVDSSVDLETVAGFAVVLRPGGKFLFDMYHPDWMRNHQLSGEADPRSGVSVRRWVHGRRCLHEIHYPSGQIDDIRSTCINLRSSSTWPGLPVSYRGAR